MNQRLSLLVATILLTIAVPTQAINISGEPLEDSVAVEVVRENIISKGIKACKAREYLKAIQLLKIFLNPRKVVATAEEKKGFSCLALAYQNVGQEAKATETIIRAILFLENSPVELANFEKTAGIIAYQQNKKILANQHWKRARQLYLADKVNKERAKTTLILAKRYKELGYVKEYWQLLKELQRTTLEVDGLSKL